MASITGKTSEKIDELFSATIDSVVLDSEGQLTYEKKSGEVVNAGSVGNSIISGIINASRRLILKTRSGGEIDVGSIGSTPLDSWPVGAVYIGVTTANPSTLLGGGTWVRFAEGRMLIGVNSADTSFDAVEETGGGKTKTLVAANLPPHPHTIAHTHSMVHEHQTASSDDEVTTNSATFERAGTSGAVTNNFLVGESSTPNTGASSAANSGNGSGTSTPLDVMNPYITAYIWKRTA